MLPACTPFEFAFVLVLFGFVKIFMSKIAGDSPLAGGRWTSMPNFTAPELSTNYLAMISDAEADDYDVDVLTDFFGQWGFRLQPIELTQA